MGLEAATNVGDLVTTNPATSDDISAGDDHIRLTKTALRQSFAGFAGAVIVTGTDGGSANTYTLTPTTALLAYGTKMVAVFAPAATNTSASTLNISGLGTKSVKSSTGSALTSGDLVSGSVYAAIYNGTEFRLVSPTQNYIEQLSFSSELPAQAGNSGKFLTTDGTNASWASVGSVSRRAITGTETVISSDKGGLVDATSGTFTLSLTAAATLGSGFYCYVRNSGTGVVTIDPASSETIAGLTTIKVYPGESFLIQCDGSNWHTVGRQVVVLLSTSTVGSPVASVDFETGFGDAEIDTIRIEGYGVTHNGGVARQARIRLKFSGAYSATNYVYQGIDGAVATTASYDQTASTVAIVLNPNTYAAGATWDMSAAVGNINTVTNNAHRVDWSCNKRGGSQATRGLGGNSAGSTVQGVQVLMNGDSISGGTFYVYGVRKS